MAGIEPELGFKHTALGFAPEGFALLPDRVAAFEG